MKNSFKVRLKAIGVLSAIAALSACAGTEDIRNSISMEYRDAKMGKPIVYPPGVDAPQVSDAFAIPPRPPAAQSDNADINDLVKPPMLLPPDERPLVEEETQATQEADVKKFHFSVGLYQAEGHQKRSDFTSAMAADGAAVTVEDYDASRSAYQLAFGYRYHSNMVLEFGYLDLGEVDVRLAPGSADDASDELSKHLPISSKGWTLSNRFDYRFAGKWRASAEVGAYVWESKDYDEVSADVPATDGSDPLLGVGLAYSMGTRFELALQYRRILFDEQNVTLWGSNLLWRF